MKPAAPSQAPQPHSETPRPSSLPVEKTSALKASESPGKETDATNTTFGRVILAIPIQFIRNLLDSIHFMLRNQEKALYLLQKPFQVKYPSNGFGPIRFFKYLFPKGF